MRQIAAVEPIVCIFNEHVHGDLAIPHIVSHLKNESNYLS